MTSQYRLGDGLGRYRYFTVNESDAWLPAEYLQECGKAVIVYVIVIWLLNFLVQHRLSFYDIPFKQPEKETTTSNGAHHDTPPPPPQKTSKEKLAFSFQITNCIINLWLGVLGIYFWFYKMPKTLSDSEKLSGFNPSAPALFNIVQISYQIWSLPISIYINESALMIVHHVTVLALAAMNISLTVGCRYFSVFFFGVVEISSVPLSIMNSFKSHPHWIRKMPRTYSWVKIVFSTSFFLTRVFLWIPHIFDFFRVVWNHVSSMDRESSVFWVLAVFLVIAFGFAMFLTALQLLWAVKIVRGLLLMAGIGSEEESYHKMDSIKSNTTNKDD